MEKGKPEAKLNRGKSVRFAYVHLEPVNSSLNRVNYLFYTLKTAYREFENRIGEMATPRGAKTEIVLNAIRGQKGDFRLVDIERACPGVGRDWIRVLLADLKKCGEVKCRGKGPAARWVYKESKGTTLK